MQTLSVQSSDREQMIDITRECEFDGPRSRKVFVQLVGGEPTA